MPDGPTLIALMNGELSRIEHFVKTDLPVASVPGNALLGFLSDRWPLRAVIIISCGGTALTCFFLWGFATSIAPLVLFVLGFGLLGLSFTTLWTRMISAIARELVSYTISTEQNTEDAESTGDDPSLLAFAFSSFAVMRGIGNISSGEFVD